MTMPVAVFDMPLAVSCRNGLDKGDRALQREAELNRFFAEVEGRALRMAEMAVRNRADALDKGVDFGNIGTLCTDGKAHSNARPRKVLFHTVFIRNIQRTMLSPNSTYNKTLKSSNNILNF